MLTILFKSFFEVDIKAASHNAQKQEDYKKSSHPLNKRSTFNKSAVCIYKS